MEKGNSSTLRLLNKFIEDKRFLDIRKNNWEKAADACFIKGMDELAIELAKPLQNSIMLSRNIFYLILYTLFSENEVSQGSEELDDITIKYMLDWIETEINSIN